MSVDTISYPLGPLIGSRVRDLLGGAFNVRIEAAKVPHGDGRCRGCAYDLAPTGYAGKMWCELATHNIEIRHCMAFMRPDRTPIIYRRLSPLRKQNFEEGG